MSHRPLISAVVPDQLLLDVMRVRGVQMAAAVSSAVAGCSRFQQADGRRWARAALSFPGAGPAPSPQPDRGYGAASEHVRKIASRKLLGGRRQANSDRTSNPPSGGRAAAALQGGAEKFSLLVAAAVTAAVALLLRMAAPKPYASCAPLRSNPVQKLTKCWLQHRQRHRSQQRRCPLSARGAPRRHCCPVAPAIPVAM